jgi:hypothetical protein
MSLPKSLKYLRFIQSSFVRTFFVSLFCCQISWAVQEAIILADKAVIYSDMDTSSPIGFISKGKKILVGDVSRNNAQVYPVIVSGKIAYIKTSDVTTEKESVDSSRLTAERFQKSTSNSSVSKFSISYFQFNSQIRLDNENGDVVDKNVFNWHGLSFRGESMISDEVDFQVIINYMFSTLKGQAYRASEFGFGGGYRFLRTKRFTAKVLGEALSIPFVTYSVGEDFRVKSYGYTLGAGINMSYALTSNWEITTTGGLYHTGLSSFDNPSPYKDSAPSFNGTRLGIGLNYIY